MKKEREAATVTSTTLSVSPGDRVSCNLYEMGRLKFGWSWQPGTVKEVDKAHALIKLDDKNDPFGHPVYVNFNDIKVIQ